MAFIISKKSRLWGKERRLYYLVKNYRDGNKIKRKTLLALKEYKSVAELLNYTEQKRALEMDRIKKLKNDWDNYHQHGKMPTLWIGSPYTFPQRLARNLEQVKANLEQCEQEINRIKSFL